MLTNIVEYKRVMPLKLLKLKLFQLVKLIILLFCLISLYFIYVHYQVSQISRSSSRFEFYNIKDKKRFVVKSNGYINKATSYFLFDEETKGFDEKSYFCLNKLVNCSNRIDNKQLCSYVPTQLGIF